LSRFRGRARCAHGTAGNPDGTAAAEGEEGAHPASLADDAGAFPFVV
jgi:hypothetical protein